MIKRTYEQRNVPVKRTHSHKPERANKRTNERTNERTQAVDGRQTDGRAPEKIRWKTNKKARTSYVYVEGNKKK